MPSLSRRRFLKISAAALFAAGAAGPAARAVTQAATKPAEGIRCIPTFCDVCFWKCNAFATVRDGQLWKIDGNPVDPLSRGRLCPRGTGGIGAHTDPDRLRTPLIRTRERGAEEWKAVTWDEALDYIAARMKTIAGEHGPEARAFPPNFPRRRARSNSIPRSLPPPVLIRCRATRRLNLFRPGRSACSTVARVRLSHALHAFRRRGRCPQRGEPAARLPRAPHAAAGSRHEAVHLLPHVKRTVPDSASAFLPFTP